MSKLLFIRYKKSENILEGGEQGSQKNYNALCAVLGKENISTIYIHDEGKRHKFYEYILGVLLFPFGYWFGLTPWRVNKIVSTVMQYDFLYVDRSLFGIISKKAKKAGYKGKVITFFHNVEKLYFEAKIGNRPWKRLIVNCAFKNDLWSCEWSDRIIALNKRDSNLLFDFYGRKADVLIPVMFRDKYDRVEYPTEMTLKKPVCFFLGAYFTANNEGIEWFVKNVFPFVNISLKIVGKNMDKLKVCDWLSPDIEVIANAVSLEEHFEAADIMILPIFKGSGMKVKTCEALMYGKNIIASDEAWEGYELDYDLSGAKCNTAEEFIKKIKDFEENPRPRFNKYSRMVFVEKYSDNLAVPLFRNILFNIQ